MSEVEKLKRQRRAERMSDPHAWAYEIEKRADQRSLTGAIAFLICLVLAANVWLLWKERDKAVDRLDIIEGYLHQTPRSELPEGSPASPR